MTPTILLVEDDPVTRAFLVAVLEAAPATVETAVDLASADACARTRAFDLWLVDANLPDGLGADWLAAQRARGLRTPAIAHTAAHDATTLSGLREAGFADVLVKPMSATTLHDAVARVVGSPTALADQPDAGRLAETEIWNDAAALAALGGQRQHVDALRGLFLGELPGAGKAVALAVLEGERAALEATLHKLRASCGFVGAARMEAAVKALQADPDSADALARFVTAVQDTLSST